MLDVGKTPWSRKWQPTLVFLPRKFHGQRSLVGCSPSGHTELDMTERLTAVLKGVLGDVCFLSGPCSSVHVCPHVKALIISGHQPS